MNIRVRTYVCIYLSKYTLLLLFPPRSTGSFYLWAETEEAEVRGRPTDLLLASQNSKTKSTVPPVSPTTPNGRHNVGTSVCVCVCMREGGHDDDGTSSRVFTLIMDHRHVFIYIYMCVCNTLVVLRKFDGQRLRSRYTRHGVSMY